MGAPIVRSFQAINGIEFGKMILNQIKNHIENDHHFRQHVTYPQITWKWLLDVKFYPGDPGEFRLETGNTFVSPGNTPLPEGSISEDVRITDEKMVAAPFAGVSADQARREANLPTSSPKVVGRGETKVVVDAPNLPIPKGDAPQVETAPQTNAESGGRVFGRSVTAKTKAAPDGAEAFPRQGSAPDVERIREIKEREGIPDDNTGDEPPAR